MDVSLGMIGAVIVIVLAVLFFGTGGSVNADHPIVDVPCVMGFGSCNSNSTNQTATPTPYVYNQTANASCYGYPHFTGGAVNRSGQDCTGNGEFTDDFFCNTYPPVGAEDWALNMSLYCTLEGDLTGVCCVK